MTSMRRVPVVVLATLCLALAMAEATALNAAPPSVRAFRAGADTLLAIEPGDVVRLILNEGRVVLEGTDGDALEVEDGSRRGIEVARNGSRLALRVRGRDSGGGRLVRVGVPAGIEIEVSGEHVDVEGRGLTGALRVNVIQGDVRVSDVRGSVELRTIDGDIEVAAVDGPVDAATVEGVVHLSVIRGSIRAQSMDGDVILDDVDGGEVLASTVDGDVTYDGTLSRGSRVELVTHDGDVLVSIPADASAEVEVSTFDGEFIPEFPVRVGRVEAGQPLRFRLGSGGARLAVQVFDGDIQLRHRPGR